MKKAELMYKALSLGLVVKPYNTKKEIEHVIEAHEQFIRLNEMMAKRPRREV